MSYNLTLNNQQLQLSLARTGGQGTKGDSVTSASIDSNGDFHVIISNAAGQQVQDINLGGATIIAEATAAKTAAEAALDTFDDRFLGVKSSAPSLDNDNDALVTGALYFDSTIAHLGVYNGSSWDYPLQAAQTSATAAAASASAASTSETNAATSATNAGTSATNAANSAAQAASSESSVSADATTASTAATNALASQSAAATSEANAGTSETNAGTSETNAANSATSAAASGVYADNRATAAAASAAAALVSENNSATSESSAASSATTAGNHSANAAANAVSANNSKTAAASSETNALNYQSGAQTAETNAATSASNAATSATAAATSATNSANSATASASSASAAQTAQAATELVFDNFDDKFLGTKASDPTVDNDGNALAEGSMYYNSTDNVIKFYSGSAWQVPSVTATNAATSATTSATNASTSATNAATSETNAAASAASSLTSANNAAASYDSFDDRYLGSKSSAPTTDNDGNSLLTGALYWNSTLDKMYVYTGAIWTVATGSIPGIKMEFVYTATAGQTVFTGSDDNSETLVMDDTKLVDVFLNGIRLVKGTDYTLNLVTDTVTFASGRTVNDMVVVQVFGNLAAAGLSISGANLTGGTINNAVIGGTTPAAGSFTTITATGTIDGRDVAADGTKLDGIETSADVTDTANVTAAGALMTTGGSVTGNVSFNDNDKAIFGAGSDLQIYHDGSASYIDDAGTGNLFVRGNNLALKNADGSKSYFFGTNGGAANVYYDGASKLATTSTGVDITGTLTSDGLTVDGNATISSSSPKLVLEDTDGAAQDDARLQVGASIFNIKRDADNLSRLTVGLSTGDISFYDTSGNAKLFWDASAESLGIGTSSPSTPLHVSTSAENVATFASTDTAARIVITDGTDTGYVNVSSGKVSLGQTLGLSANNLNITTTGSVGIGTSNPETKLHIEGGSLLVDAYSVGEDAGIFLREGFINIDQPSITVWDKDNGGVSPDGISINGNDGIRFRENGGEVARFDDGNFGIGTSSPDSKLHISGTLGDAIIRLERNDTTIVADDIYGEIQFEGQDASAGSSAGIRGKIVGIAEDTTGGMALAFQTAAGYGSATERMRLNSAGKLSLGTDLTNADSSLLHITSGSTDNFAMLQLENTNTGSATAPDIAFYRNSSSPSNNDNLGALHFYANNSASERTLSGNFYLQSTDVTDGTEDSKFIMTVMKDGSLREHFSVGSTEVVINEESVDVNFRVESDNDTAAFFVNGADGNVGMSVTDPASHTPTSHNTGKRSFVIHEAGGSQFVASRADSTVGVGNYVGGYLFKSNDLSVNKFGGMIATADDTSGNANLEFYPVSNGYENGNEGTMQLDDSGDMYIRAGGIRVGRSHGGVYTTAEESVIIYSGGVSNTQVRIQARSGTGGDPIFLFERLGTTKVEIEENGDFLSATNSYGGTSDQRLKENIVASGSQWDDIKALQIKKYSMIEDGLDAPNKLGVIAQDLQASGMNGLVKQHFKMDEEDNPILDADGNQEEYLSVKYSVLYMKAIKALQEAMAKIEVLETKVAALEAE